MSWAHLPNDVARCLGRRDWTPETDTCPVRSGCKRYKAAVEGQFGRKESPAPWHLWLCSTPVHERRLPVEVAP